jgi:hypothetical protein
MNIAVTNTRPLNKEEMRFLHKHVAELWAARAGAAVRVSGAYVKASAWMAANGFTKFVNKVTSENVTDKFDKATKIGTAFAVGAIIAMPILPALPLAAAVASAGTYMMGAIGQALHNVTEKDLEKLQSKAEKAIERAENLDETLYETRNEEYRKWKNYLDDEREERIEQFKERAEEIVDGVKQDISDAWITTKEKFRKKVKAAKQGVETTVGTVKGKVVGTANAIKSGIDAGVDKVKAGVTAVKNVAAEVADSVKHEYGELSGYIKREREKKRAQEQAAIDYYKAQKAKQKEAEKLQRSKKCLDFLTTTTFAFGKDWIAENCLTEEDRVKYENGLKVNERIAAAKEAQRRSSIQIKLDAINAAYGNEFTVEEYDAMPKGRRQQIDKKYNELKELEQIEGVTL